MYFHNVRAYVCSTFLSHSGMSICAHVYTATEELTREDTGCLA